MMSPAMTLRSFALAVLASCLAAGCRQAEDPSVVRLNGRIEATLVDLAPRVTGRVVSVHAREGDRVKAGDVLVRLDLGETSLLVERNRSAVASAASRVSDLEAGSRQAEIAAGQAEVADRRAAVDAAQRELERQTFLLARKVGTERDVDRAKTEVERTRAALASSESRLKLLREGARRWQVQQAQSDLQRTRTELEQSKTILAEAEIRAPADAVVVHRIAEPGQLLAPGQPALTLAFMDRLYVRTFVPETRLGAVKPGQPAEVVVDAWKDRTFKARIAEISADAEFTPKAVETRAERVNLVYAAKVDLESGWDAPLVPGQPAEVIVRTGQAAPSPAGQPGQPATPR
jgi:HlyD family secretion protein